MAEAQSVTAVESSETEEQRTGNLDQDSQQWHGTNDETLIQKDGIVSGGCSSCAFGFSIFLILVHVVLG